MGDSAQNPFTEMVIRRLSCGYGSDFRLEIAELAVPLSVPIVLKGSNGSGKTTLLKALAKLDGPERYDYEITGSNGFYYVEQATEASVFLRLRVDECIMAMAEGRVSFLGFTRTSAEAFIDFLRALPSQVRGEVEKFRHRFVEELSGGQRSLLGIAAAAIAGANCILLLDEPAAHLDFENRRLVASFISGLVAGGRAVWTVSHDEHFTALLDNHHTLMIENGTVRNVFARKEVS